MLVSYGVRVRVCQKGRAKTFFITPLTVAGLQNIWLSHAHLVDLTDNSHSQSEDF